MLVTLAGKTAQAFGNTSTFKTFYWNFTRDLAIPEGMAFFPYGAILRRRLNNPVNNSELGMKMPRLQLIAGEVSTIQELGVSVLFEAVVWGGGASSSDRMPCNTDNMVAVSDRALVLGDFSVVMEFVPTSSTIGTFEWEIAIKGEYISVDQVEIVKATYSDNGTLNLRLL